MANLQAAKGLFAGEQKVSCRAARHESLETQAAHDDKQRLLQPVNAAHAQSDDSDLDTAKPQNTVCANKQQQSLCCQLMLVGASS